MAEHTRSRIPVYTKTKKPPVFSSGYIAVLKDVRAKRAEIEAKECNIAELKDSLSSHNLSALRRTQTKPTTKETHTSDSQTQSGFIGSQLRSTIVTPGGTKRKGIEFDTDSDIAVDRTQSD